MASSYYKLDISSRNQTGAKESRIARKKGFMGLCQPLKSFRDNPFNPIKYMNKEYLNSLGDLEKNKS